MNKPELLSPAGDREKLETALRYGADAVYAGGPAYGLRAGSGNFTRDELADAVRYTHAQGKKLYVTVNVYPHNDELAALPDYVRFLAEIGADAILVADLGVFSIAREAAPMLPVHISTQANNTNWATVNAWHRLGASRVVLARELSLAEIRDIRAQSSVELEMFVHGAMCISYSGRCLLSSYLTGRDANRGNCAQPCRWRYHLVEEKRPGEYFPVEEDDRGTFFFNSKDLCLLPHLDEILACGVHSLKIEGRMKSVHYVASVTKAYRMAIDAYLRDPAHFTVDPAWLDELQKVSHRAYTTGFSYHRPGADDQIYGTSSYLQTSDFVGVVRDYDAATGDALVEQRNHMKRGETLEFFRPTKPTLPHVLDDLRDEDGAPLTAAPHAQQRLRIRTATPVEIGSILRRPLGDARTHEKTETVCHS